MCCWHESPKCLRLNCRSIGSHRLGQQGKRGCVRRLVRRYYSFVRLEASSYGLVGGDSDDLIQEGLVGFYKAIRDFRTDGESSFVPCNFAELCITCSSHRGEDRNAQQAHAAATGTSPSRPPPPARAIPEPTLTRSSPAPRRVTGQPGDLVRGAALAGGVVAAPARRPRVARALALPRCPVPFSPSNSATRSTRLQERGRAAAREAQAGRTSPLARRACLRARRAYLMFRDLTWPSSFGAGRHRPPRLSEGRSPRAPASRDARPLRRRPPVRHRPLAAAHARDGGWDRGAPEAAARQAYAGERGSEPGDLRKLPQVVDRPGIHRRQGGVPHRRRTPHPRPPRRRVGARGPRVVASLPRAERMRRILERDGAECVWCRGVFEPGRTEPTLEHALRG